MKLQKAHISASTYDSTMKKSSLIVALGIALEAGPVAVAAYTNGATTSRATSTAFSSSALPNGRTNAPHSPVSFVERKQRNSQNTEKSVSSRTRRLQKYDLGLGKNPPVVGGVKAREEAAFTDVYEAARFWVEHEAAVDFPSPHDSYRHHRYYQQHQQPQQDSELTTEAPKERRDVAAVRPASNERRAARKEKVELNTVWVEMMIREQRQLQKKRKEQKNLHYRQQLAFSRP